MLAAGNSGALPINTQVRRRIFPGWYVVAAVFLGGFVLYGGGLYSFILFVKPLAEEFNWSHAATGGLVSAFWLSAPLALFADPLIKRFGTTRLVCAGILIESICLIFLFTATELWQMYLLRALAGLGKVLYAINMPIILARWFSRRFGLAIALMYAGWHLGGSALAPVSNYLLTEFGWRSASVILGVALLIVALPVSILALRLKSAAELGLGLDGDPPGARSQEHVIESAQPAAGYIGALGTLLQLPSFRLILLATVAVYIGNTGVLIHQASIAEAFGLSSGAAATLLGATAGFAALGAGVVGYVADRFTLASTAVVEHSLMAVGVLGLLLFSQVQSFPLFAMHAIAFGLATGGMDVFYITMTKRRTPAELFAQAWGIWYCLILIIMVIAPILSGWLFDVTGSYIIVLSVQLSLIIVAMALSILVARRRRKVAGLLAPACQRQAS